MVAVLGFLLLTSGISSFVFVGRLGWSVTGGCAAAAGAALFAGLVVPWAVDLYAGLPFVARVMASMLMVVPVGIGLGMPFTSALKGISVHENEDSGGLVAWAWSCNGIAAVGGSVGALILSSTLGFSMTAVFAATSYLVVAWISRS